MKPPALPSSVYFARRASDGAIKIGTSTNVGRRLAALRSQHGCAVELLSTELGGRARETEIHDALADHRLSGEWFAPTADVLVAAATAGALLPTRDIAAPGPRLRAWRLREGMTMTALARAVRASGASVVYEWERGTRRPRVHNAIALDRVTAGAVPCEAWGFEPLAILTAEPTTAGS